MPEGFRKALRLMRLAERFGAPIVTFVDTTGAFPGEAAEARGQAEAIARNLREMSALRTPIVSVLIGEGGSGGALALSVSDRILMLEYAIFTVISPEGCAAILWREGERREEAAEALKMTAQDVLDLGVIDAIIPEPLGGAHRDFRAAARAVDSALRAHLSEILADPTDALLRKRYERFRAIGEFIEMVFKRESMAWSPGRNLPAVTQGPERTGAAPHARTPSGGSPGPASVVGRTGSFFIRYLRRRPCRGGLRPG
jgi:acetyl-CoA carboxylase carboxyl transferase subunit alpha